MDHLVTRTSWTSIGQACGGARGWWRRALLLAALTALAAAASPADTSAQSDAVRIVGRVLDAESGRGLVGARVVAQGTDIGTLSGIDGRYILTGLPGGTLTLSVSYLGYGDRTVTEVDGSGSGTVNVDIAMTPAAVAIEGITVTAAGQRGTISRALDEQRTAVGVINAVTSEQISRSPDSDAAAAVQRVSGVTVQDGKFVFVRGLGERYTTTSLNGSRIPSPEPERKMVPLDLFPSGLLQSITTSKTFTPNLPGDFSGAQIDIRTREYPAGRQLSFSLSQGLNSEVTGASLPMAPTVGGEWLAAATGPRQIPTVVANTPAPQPGAQTNEMVNAMRNAWSVQERSGRPSSSLGISLGGTDELFGRRIGYLASGTYSLNDEINVGIVRENPAGDHYEGTMGRQSVLLGGLLNFSTMFGTHSRIAIDNTYNRTAENEGRLERGFYENHSTNIQIERLRYVEREVRSNQLQGEHQLTRTHRLNWAVSSSAVSRKEPDRSEFVTWLDPETPTWYNQEGAFRAYGDLTESSLEASADYEIDLGSGGSLLRFGALVRDTERDAYDTGYAISSREWGPSDPRWQMSPEEFFDGRFSTNGERLFALGVFNAGGSYGASDRLAAGYGMLQWSISPRLSLVGGARVEQSDVVVDYEDLLGNTGSSTPSYTDVLPSLALNFELTSSQKLRLSASQTLARPEYREIAPICYRVGLGEEQRCGNPDLVRTLIQNFDARWEHYPRLGEMLSVAIFAKRFQDPIEPRYLGRSGTNSLWFENAESGHNYGVELEAMRNLGFLAPALSDLSASVNVTLISSEVETGTEGDPKRAMTGQAPYVFNAGLTWARPDGGASATLLYNVVGERIINARPSGQLVEDMLELPRPGLDLSIRFPLLGAVEGKLDLKNLLDSPYEVRQGDALRSYYRSGRSLSIGASWSQ